MFIIIVTFMVILFSLVGNFGAFDKHTDVLEAENFSPTGDL